jgi:hypothetical protein
MPDRSDDLRPEAVPRRGNLYAEELSFSLALRSGSSPETPGGVAFCEADVMMVTEYFQRQVTAALAECDFKPKDAPYILDLHDEVILDQIRDQVRKVLLASDRTQDEIVIDIHIRLPKSGPMVAPAQRRRPGRPKGTPTLQPLAKDGFLISRADRICKAVVEALAPDAIRDLTAKEWTEHGVLPGEGWWKAYPFRAGKKGKGQVKGVIGFTRQPPEAVWDTLQRNGPLAVKAQYALWARAYRETGAEPGRFIPLPISGFCDDIGFKRHKGTHRPENKRQGMQVLELMASLYAAIHFLTPKGKAHRLRGDIWLRGIIGEQYDSYADLFGTNRAGNPELWEPETFNYAPGAFFDDPDWRRFNSYTARVGEGLMQLRTDRDQWAIMVGGYLGMISRMNGYRPLCIRVQVLLERTGLMRADRRNPGRALDKLEKALDRLVEVKVIQSWEYTDAIEETDMDDAEDLEKILHAADRREMKSVRISWPLPEVTPGPEPLAEGNGK